MNKKRNYAMLEKRVIELKKRVAALEVQVQEQLKVAPKQVINEQIQILQSAQEKCLKNGSFETVELIAKTIADISTQFQSYHY